MLFSAIITGSSMSVSATITGISMLFSATSTGVQCYLVPQLVQLLLQAIIY